MLPRTEAFFDFITEREEIRQHRLADLPFPWTKDLILQSYKFTNVFRHHDKTSSVLRQEFYEPHFFDDEATVLMNCALARYFGTYEFMRAVGWQQYDSFDFERIKAIAAERLAAGQRVFTGAYVITNQGISAPKQEVVVDVFLRGLHAKLPSLLAVKNKYHGWQALAEAMSTLTGFGGTGFMVKEILLDTTYTGFWHMTTETLDGPMTFPCDWWSWTPIGPGGIRGAARVYGDEDADKIKPTAAMFAIMDLFADQEKFWKWYSERPLAPTDIQFQLCEFDKYERVRLGQGKPRSRYRVS